MNDSDSRLSADFMLMKREMEKYLKTRMVYYIVAKEKLDYFEHWRWDVYPVVNHEIKDGKIVAKSAFWGTDTYDAATSKIFESEKEAKKYKHRQNALEVLFNEPENRESWTWKEEFEKWLPDMLPLWR